MIGRVLKRCFKSWHQYQAEKAGISLEEYMSRRKKTADGDFEAWKTLEENTSRLNFLLDHCSPEEQSTYLREFDTIDLGKFLMNNICQLNEEELELLANEDVQYHALPVLNTIMGLPHKFKTARIDANQSLSELHKLRLGVTEGLKKKIQEIEWKRIDAEMTETTKEIKLK